MKKSVVYCLCAVMLFSFSLIGCAKGGGGNQKLAGTSSSEIQDKLVEGRTTKAEVRDWLGEPTGISKNKNGTESWRYNLTNHESKVKASTFIPYIGGLVGGSESKTENRTLTINFKNGVVSDYSFDAHDYGSSTGVL